MKLAGRVVVVTGAANGIGQALAERFVAEGAKTVAFADLDGAGAERAATPLGQPAYRCDVSKEADIAALADAVETRFGPIDLFCSNAGIAAFDPDPENVASAPDAAWQRSFAVNVMAHVYAARVLVPRMAARGGGYFLNTVSAAGLLSQIGGAPYATTKHAAIGFAECLAITHRHQGIRVSVLCPQGVDTPMLRSIPEGGQSLDGVLTPAAVAEAAVAGLERESFLILPHPQVETYMQSKTANYDRWLGGMAKLRARILQPLADLISEHECFDGSMKSGQPAPNDEGILGMDFQHSPRVKALADQIEAFMAEHIYPNEERHFREAIDLGPWAVYPVIEELKPIAKKAGLWNLFVQEKEYGPGLSNVDYAPLCEIMGRSPLAPEVFNCSAPDVGNMEVLMKYGTAAQKKEWLLPLLDGTIRSAFAMTEPRVASSDATNVESSIRRDGDHYIVNGRKWYTTNATDPRCKIFIFMGKTDPDNPDRHVQQSQILVPRDTPGVTVLRPLPVFNFYGMPDRASEVEFKDVRVPVGNMLLGEGRGFEIAQGRLGPGRIHHCMRTIGLAERALEKMCRRTEQRVTFGRKVSEQSVTRERIAEARIMIEQARLLTLKAAYMMDTVGNKEARAEIAMIKVAVPNMACQVVDWAIQSFGAGGLSNDFGLGVAYATARLLRLADGPDEVHRDQIARLELRRYRGQENIDRGGTKVLPLSGMPRTAYERMPE